MKDFDYYAPTGLGESIELLDRFGTRARILAGGTELINELRSGKAQPDTVVDLKHISGLENIEFTPSGLKLGALVRVWDIETSEAIRQSPFAVLSEAAGTLGSVQVRNKATVVGNICRASPSADMIPPLMAMGATLKVTGKNGGFSVTLPEFLLGPGKTILKPGEIVTQIFVPVPPDFSACTYIKLSPRKAMDLAVAGVAVKLTLVPDTSECLDAVIALGAVAPTTMRASKAEAALVGKELSESVIAQAAELAAAESRPVDDIRSSAWYRRKMVTVLVKRGLNSSLGKIEVGKGYGYANRN